MKHTRYMAKNEMMEYVRLASMLGFLDSLLETTEDKDWRRRIKTASTLLTKIIDERWVDMEKMEQNKAARRIKTLGVKVYSYDDYKADSDDEGRKVTITQDDFFDLVDASWLNCYGCPQGELVKNCPRRKLFHRLGLQVHQSRQNPAEGECEWRYNNEQYAVTPQYRAIEQELIHQMP